MKKTTKKTLQARLQELEKRLKKYGLDDNKTTHDLPGEASKTVHPQQAAERLLILLAVAVTAYNFEEGEKVMDWLKGSNSGKQSLVKKKNFLEILIRQTMRNKIFHGDSKQHTCWHGPLKSCLLHLIPEVNALNNRSVNFLSMFLQLEVR
jgi:hypothetical protein